MKYVALIYGDAARWDAFSDDEKEAVYDTYRAFADEAREAGVLVAGAELGSTRDATTVRVREADTLVTDGPYAETKEVLGGIVVLGFKDMSEAVEVLSKHPALHFGVAIERPHG